MSQTSRISSKDQALKILNSRKRIAAGNVGTLMQTVIVGNGTIVPVTDKDGNQVYGSDKQPLFKVIYNTKLNSAVAQANARNQAILKEALGLYAAGKADEAGEKINEYLNKVQVSFSIILPTGQAAPFASKQVVQGQVAMVTTENGSLLTLENVSAVRAVEAQAVSIDSFEALLGAETEGDDDDIAGA